ncbi:MAG: hypothetical protein HN737_07850 [Desulfobacterales bacterium]|nr:hypothetical protein [Desulfobacteraceae bacterium]MBT4365698.1 hypothetical protein [Desulfobacteraceae bacterium]MBT7086064.1 hypothetical protein [Desulfobacterales bacterium]MBT7697309.1 hypothetical protein [Desulfobacterales bacterium]
MSIMTRFLKIFKADLHGVMDQLEDKSLLLKQHLREMEEALEKKSETLQQIISSRDLAVRERERHNIETEKLEKDITAAIEKNKDDVARLLIKKEKTLKKHMENLCSHIETLLLEITIMKDSIEKQSIEYDELMLKSREYFHRTEQKQWEKNLSEIIPFKIYGEPTEEEIEFDLVMRKENINQVIGGS